MYTHPVPKGIPFETLGSTSQTESKAAERAAKVIETMATMEYLSETKAWPYALIGSLMSNLHERTRRYLAAARLTAPALAIHQKSAP